MGGPSHDGTPDPLVCEIAAIRKARGLSQRVVAERMGTSQSAVSDMETGRAQPGILLVRRYGEACEAHLTLTCDPLRFIEWKAGADHA
jgi:transcriptional regulator with XRE-family HTH domain